MDAQVRAAQRGYGDLQGDVETQQSRGQTDYLQGQGDIERGRSQSLADMLRNKTRVGQQLATGRQRLGEDYARTNQKMDTSYRNLAEGQTGAAIAGGTGAQGGTLAAALAKRTANRADDQVDVDRSRDRGLQDFAGQERQFDEDYAEDVRRINEGADISGGRLGQSYTRQGGDLANQLSRAGRELGFFEQDTAGQKFFQAAQAGTYVMPGRGDPGGPAKNEFSGPNGPYRVVQRGRVNVRVDPNNREISRTRRPRRR